MVCPFPIQTHTFVSGRRNRIGSTPPGRIKAYVVVVIVSVVALVMIVLLLVMMLLLLVTRCRLHRVRHLFVERDQGISSPYRSNVPRVMGDQGQLVEGWVRLLHLTANTTRKPQQRRVGRPVRPRVPPDQSPVPPLD